MTASRTASATRRENASDLPAAGAAAFRSRFLGLTDPVERLILTPLGFFLSRLTKARQLHSIWPSGLVGSVPIVQSPQGRPIVDAIFCLPAGCQVVFLGIGGALRPPAATGQWVCVDRAWNGRREYLRSLDPPADLGRVTAATAGSLTESWLSTHALAHRADVVDMETSHVYEVARRRGIRALSLLLVSDEPPAQPFWETDLGRLAPQVGPVMELLGPWLAGNSMGGTPFGGTNTEGGEDASAHALR